MPRPQNRDAARTRRAVLEAARHAFADHGLQGVSLAAISGAAGIRRPSLLYHFPSKDLLYAAVVREVFASLRAALSSAMSAGPDFRTRLLATATTFASFLSDSPDVARIVLREMLDPGPGRELLVEEIAPLLEVVTSFVAREGEGVVAPGVDIRGAIMQIASNIVLRAAAQDLRPRLWGSGEQDELLTARLLLRSPESRARP